jgi:hypothetical protein
VSWIGTTKVIFRSGYCAPRLRQSTIQASRIITRQAHIKRAIPIHYLRWGRVDLNPEALTSDQSLYQNVGPLNNPSHSENTPIIYPSDIGITYIS